MLNLLAAVAVASLSLSTPKASVLFGLLAEPVLYLDAEVGACCHSACSDCEWRTADGGYRFDVMRSARPKCAACPRSAAPWPALCGALAAQNHPPLPTRRWVACYLQRDFADERGAHTPVWASALFDDPVGEAKVDRARFGEALRALPYQATLGPKGTVPQDVADAGADDEAVDALWQFLADGADSDGVLSAAHMRRRLQDMSLDSNREGAIGEGPDAIAWKEFAKALGAKPFDRF